MDERIDTNADGTNEGRYVNGTRKENSLEQAIRDSQSKRKTSQSHL